MDGDSAAFEDYEGDEHAMLLIIDCESTMGQHGSPIRFCHPETKKWMTIGVL